MTLRTIWRVIARWKWIVIPGLVLALGAGTAMFLRTPKTYTVEASYLFLSPVADTKGVASNPFLQLGNGVSQAVDVLAVSLTDGQTVRSFTKNEPKLEYTAARDASVGAPLMVISVQDVNQKAAAATLASLGTILAERLNSMQAKAGAPQTQWITMTKLTDDPKPKVGYSDGIRNGVLGLAAVLLVTFIAVAIAERIRVHRETRRERLKAEGAPQKKPKKSKQISAHESATEPSEPLRELPGEAEPTHEIPEKNGKSTRKKSTRKKPHREPSETPETREESETSEDAEVPQSVERSDETDEEAPIEAPAESPIAEGKQSVRAPRRAQHPGRPSVHDDDDLEEVLADDPLTQLRG